MTLICLLAPEITQGIVLLVLCLAQFMLVLDISVTNVALASIRADLGFAVADLTLTRRCPEFR
jgi:hypothetical protein